MRKLALLGLGGLLLLWPVACGDDDDGPGDGDSGGSAGTGGSMSNAGTSNAGTSNAGTSNAGTSNAGTSNAGSPSTGGTDSGGSMNSGGSSNAGAATGGSGEDVDAGMGGDTGDVDSGMTLMGRAASCAEICATHATVAAMTDGCEVVDDCENVQCTGDELFPGDCTAEYDAFLECLAGEPASGFECSDADADPTTPDIVGSSAGTCAAEEGAWLACEFS